MNTPAHCRIATHDLAVTNLPIRTVQNELYAPRPDALGWTVQTVIPTRVGTFIVAHVVGHDPRFIVGVRS